MPGNNWGGSWFGAVSDACNWLGQWFGWQHVTAPAPPLAYPVTILMTVDQQPTIIADVAQQTTVSMTNDQQPTINMSEPV